jgi:hypothetical protein
VKPFEILVAFQAVPVALVFMLSGAFKLLEPHETVRVVRALGSSEGVARGTVLTVGVGELVLAAVVLIAHPQLAACLTIAALVAYSAFIALAMHRKLNLRCGCFGPGLAAEVSWWLIARNALVAIPAFVLLRADFRWYEVVTDARPPALLVAALEFQLLLLISGALGVRSLLDASERTGRLQRSEA